MQFSPILTVWLVRAFTNLNVSFAQLSIRHESSIVGNSRPVGSMLLAVGRSLNLLHCMNVIFSRLMATYVHGSAVSGDDTILLYTGELR